MAERSVDAMFSRGAIATTDGIHAAVVAITPPPKGRSLNPADHFISSIAVNAAAAPLIWCR
jgi:hypothetical protein